MEPNAFPQPPRAYRCLRRLARLYLYFRQIRVLESRRLDDHPAAVLAVHAPESLPTALLLTAAFERPVLWVFDPAATRTTGGRWAARLLGAVTWDDAASSGRAFERIADALRTGWLVAWFQARTSASPPDAMSSWVNLLLALGERWPHPAELAVFPVDVFIPPRHFAHWETLAAFGEPIYPAEHLHRAQGEASIATESLHASLEESWAQNPFRLLPASLERAEAELEDLLRAELQDTWSGRAHWRENPADFELSEEVKDWMQWANTSDPARLVVLAESVASYRRAHRLHAERQFAVETAGDWLASSLGRAVAWAEAAAGLPIALYGLLNHVPALVGLAALRRARAGEHPDRRVEWSLRAAIVLAVYAVEIVVCDRWRGRAAAGYYALTLPVSGAYLWRYVRLWHTRIRVLWFKVWTPMATRRLQRLRRRVTRQLDQEINRPREGPRSVSEGSLRGLRAS